jgi:hypothetical protein
MSAKNKSNAPQRIKLIVSDDEKPEIRGKQEGGHEVVSVSLVEPNLEKSSRIGARLCGGTSTCVAIVDVGEESA